MVMDVKTLIDELVRDEGMRTKPYHCTAGKLTIGVGRNIEEVGITEEEARYLLENDLGRVRDELDQALPWWRTLSGDYAEAAAQALNSAWARQVGARSQRIATMIREG
jgi:lysozyme